MPLQFKTNLKNTVNEIIKDISRVLADTGGPIVVIPHSNPDGDAIGSAYALAIVLKNAGKEVKVVTPNDYPGFLSWLSGEVPILNYLKQRTVSEAYVKQCSMMFCVDFNEIGRVDEMQKTVADFRGIKVLVDHHPDPSFFCDFTVSEPDYSSTAELVFDLIQALGLGDYLDKKAAEALYAGIMTDTGSFSFNTSRPSLYRVLMALMTYGIDTEAIHSLVYDNFSADRMRLMGYSLVNKLVALPEYRTAYISLNRDELKMFNFVPGDTEGFVNIPLSISNIVFSALFLEKEKYVKVSFRSKGTFPVNTFSSMHFGGGGHRNAAGGEDSESLEKVIEKFTQLLPAYSGLLINADNTEENEK